MNRTIVIGDLHGCHDEALDLFERAAVTADDRVIFAGDLVDRGPKPRECVELAMLHESVIGNHEEKHLQQRKRRSEDLVPDHARTRSLLGDEHYRYFSRLPYVIRLPEHGAAVVHAGAYPGRALGEQEPYHLLHIQCVSPPERKSYWPSKAPETHRFWANDWLGPERLIFGHTVLDRPFVGAHAVGIDGGAAHGGELRAVILPSWEIVSVPSRQTPRGPTRVPRFEVLPGARCYS